MQRGQALNEHKKNHRLEYQIVKRAFDVIIALTGIVVLIPMELAIAILIKIEDGEPVIFSQQRIGKKGKLITIHKFRSMRCTASDYEKHLTPEQQQEYEKEYKLDDDPRITRIGRFIRNTSIDEIPQFYDVIRGEMSIIGSRPILPEELKYYSEEEQRLLLSNKPGITGYWQVMGRNDALYSTGERQDLELYYAKNAGVALDIKIIAKTIPAVFSMSGK